MAGAFRSSPPKAQPILVVALSGRVCGIDAHTGKWLWRNELPGGGSGEVAIAIQASIIVASAQAPTVFALDYATGETLWSASTGGWGRASIVIEEERVYVSKAGEVDCFDLAGNHLWRQNLPGAGTGRTAIGFPGNVSQADSRE